MIAHKSRTLWALALGLAISAWFTGTAQAVAIQYSAFGQVDKASPTLPDFVYYSGVPNGSTEPPGSIDLGKIFVSPLALSNDVIYDRVPFSIFVNSGSTAGGKISGLINGKFGPNTADPNLSATITEISQYGKDPLPFAFNLPLQTPLKLALPTGPSPAATGLTGAVSPAPIPEPTSIAVFAVALGGLGLWHRRRSR